MFVHVTEVQYENRWPIKNKAMIPYAQF